MPRPLEYDKVHIARNGEVLGLYDWDKLEDMLDTGHLLQTDHWYDPEAAEWVSLSTLASAPVEDPEPYPNPPPPPKFGVAPDPESSSDPGKKSARRTRSSAGKSRAKKKTETALAGWIACLFAFGISAAMWAWAQNLGVRLESADEKIVELNRQIEGLIQEKQFLSELTPGGQVRGVITYEPVPDQVAIMSGATVGLYHRADVEAALIKAIQSGDTTSEEGFNRAVELMKSIISSPLSISLTDSNGRIDMKVPGPGNYVLIASAAKEGNSGAERYFWIMGFTSSDQPSNLMLMNEKNAISKHGRPFAITDIRPMDSGAPAVQPSETPKTAP